MTAADEAAELLAEADSIIFDETGIVASGTELIAALIARPDLLARMAIDAGGMVEDGSYWLPDDWFDEGDGRSGVYYDDDAPPHAEPLYRKADR